MKSEIGLDMRREFYKIGWSPVRIQAVPERPLFSLLKKQNAATSRDGIQKATKRNKQTYDKL
jgi:hypothetical protein